MIHMTHMVVFNQGVLFALSRWSGWISCVPGCLPWGACAAEDLEGARAALGRGEDVNSTGVNVVGQKTSCLVVGGVVTYQT